MKEVYLGVPCLVNPLLVVLVLLWPYVSRTLGCLGVVFLGVESHV